MEGNTELTDVGGRSFSVVCVRAPSVRIVGVQERPYHLGQAHTTEGAGWLSFRAAPPPPQWKVKQRIFTQDDMNNIYIYGPR